MPEPADEIPDASLPVLSIAGSDPRARMYQRIADVHKRIVEIKWRARTAKAPIQVDPKLVLHCEEAVAFLAEELLELRSAAEDALVGSWEYIPPKQGGTKGHFVPVKVVPPEAVEETRGKKEIQT
jgi:hypothetical protein